MKLNLSHLLTVHRAAVLAPRAALPAQEARLPPLVLRPGRAPAALGRPVAPAAQGGAENRKESESEVSIFVGGIFI